MNTAIVVVGAVLFTAGLVSHFLEQRLSRRVELRTRGRSDALTRTEVWLNTREFTKRRKLWELVRNDSDEDLKKDAAAALKFGALRIVFGFFGIVIIWVGLSAS